MRRTQHPASCLRLDPVRKHDLKISGGSENFETGGGRKTIYQIRPHLSQIRTTKYMLFTRKKRLFEKNEPIGALRTKVGGHPHSPPPL